MNAFLLAFERASLFGLAALFVALVAQWVLDGRVPASWRVWLWRVALLQTALALVPLAPLRLPVLPPSSPVATSSASSQPVVASPPSLSLPLPVPGPSNFASGALPKKEPIPEVAVTSAPVRADSTQRAYPVGGWLLGVYAFGLGVQCLGLARCVVRVRRSLRACRPVQEPEVRVRLQAIAQRMRISGLPRLLQSEAGSPCLVGIVRPSIVLPAPFLVGQNCDLEAVLCHELAHFKRRDLVWNALLWVVQSLF